MLPHICVSYTLQSALENGQEAEIVEVDFRAVFDRVNHQGILLKLRPAGVEGSVLSVMTVSLLSVMTGWVSEQAG